MAAPRRTRSERLLRVLADYDDVVIIMHDNPDPDAMASGWGLKWMIEQKLPRQIQSVRLLGGGEIVRAENRHMVKLLEVPIELVRQAVLGPKTAVILVDCDLGAQNHLVRGSESLPTAVLDHHEADNGKPKAKRGPRLPFRDVRSNVAATASIVGSYLREQDMIPGSRLATGLLYAIRTETRGSETHYTRLDRSILRWATERAEPSWLAEIEDAPLPREYFSDLVLALQSTLIFDDTALCLLPRAHGPETVGEVADLLIRCQGLQRVLCGAVFHDDIVLSVRTDRDAQDAAKLIQRTLEGLGQSGGHTHRAGGKIPGAGRGASRAEVFSEDLRVRWLRACGVDPHQGNHLIARNEIVEHLYVKGAFE